MSTIRFPQFIHGKIITGKPGEHPGYEVVARTITDELPEQFMKKVQLAVNIGTPFDLDRRTEYLEVFLSSVIEGRKILARFMRNPKHERGRSYLVTHYIVLAQEDFDAISSTLLTLVDPHFTKLTPSRTFTHREDLPFVEVEVPLTAPSERYKQLRRYGTSDSWSRLLSVLDGVFNRDWTIITHFSENIEEKVALVQALYALIPPTLRRQLSFTTASYVPPHQCKARLQFVQSYQKVDEDVHLVQWSRGRVFSRSRRIDEGYAAYLDRIKDISDEVLKDWVQRLEEIDLKPGSSWSDYQHELISRLRKDYASILLRQDIRAERASVGEVITLISDPEISVGDEALEEFMLYAADRALSREPQYIETVASKLAGNVERLASPRFWSQLQKTVNSTSLKNAFLFLERCMAEERFRNHPHSIQIVNEWLQIIFPAAKQKNGLHGVLDLAKRCLQANLASANVVAKAGIWALSDQLSSAEFIRRIIRAVVQSGSIEKRTANLESIVLDSKLGPWLKSISPAIYDLFYYLTGKAKGSPEELDAVLLAAFKEIPDASFFAAIAGYAIESRRLELISPELLKIIKASQEQSKDLLHRICTDATISLPYLESRGAAMYMCWAMALGLSDYRVLMPSAGSDRQAWKRFLRGVLSVADSPQRAIEALSSISVQELLSSSYYDMLLECGDSPLRRMIMETVAREFCSNSLPSHEALEVGDRLLDQYWQTYPNGDERVLGNIIEGMLLAPLRERSSQAIVDAAKRILDKRNIGEESLTRTLLSTLSTQSASEKEYAAYLLAIIKAFQVTFPHLTHVFLSSLNRREYLLRLPIEDLEYVYNLVYPLSRNNYPGLSNMLDSIRFSMAAQLLIPPADKDFVEKLSRFGLPRIEDFRDLIIKWWRPADSDDAVRLIKYLKLKGYTEYADLAQKYLLEGHVKCDAQVTLNYRYTLAEEIVTLAKAFSQIDDNVIALFDELSLQEREKWLELCKDVWKYVIGPKDKRKKSRAFGILIERFIDVLKPESKKGKLLRFARRRRDKTP